MEKNYANAEVVEKTDIKNNFGEGVSVHVKLKPPSKAEVLRATVPMSPSIYGQVSWTKNAGGFSQDEISNFYKLCNKLADNGEKIELELNK